MNMTDEQLKKLIDRKQELELKLRAVDDPSLRIQLETVKQELAREGF
jgi:hypothetical protein